MRNLNKIPFRYITRLGTKPTIPQPRNFFRIVNQYEKGVVFTLGKFSRILEPGFRIVIPLLEESTIIDFRLQSYTLDKQEIISKDNISLIVDAVVFYRANDPELLVNKVLEPGKIVQEFVQIKIRELLSNNTLHEILVNREKFSQEIYESASTLEEWGIKIERVNLKDIKFEQSIVRAMAKVAEAEQLRQSKLIHAQSEVQTAEQILAAATMLEKSPVAIRIKELDILSQIAKEQSNTIVYIPGSVFESVPKIQQDSSPIQLNNQ
ncbi:hypothetical protein DICPUDRAFT_157643 [Dictyostelium purpureum]|uniref:Band 7 domain-containing protein n=1 Tax=Dictyostelium purpureum TaxID=5786 RepID=F0ZZN2_DICPU|nr:uncharacterized protein DICPUDRAFT_157643 [Dictyostelium purpureum]EGC30592.1 hypothetical protein DICPUDRAFT_157643 [Dictyostelium purpureum]|eukprot:XP_003292880.1 hypothetical protein DICPUDRAFT_157643 [Dictyostelium purpureum]